jgi:hypothetical protein
VGYSSSFLSQADQPSHLTPIFIEPGAVSDAIRSPTRFYGASCCEIVDLKLSVGSGRYRSRFCKNLCPNLGGQVRFLNGCQPHSKLRVIFVKVNLHRGADFFRHEFERKALAQQMIEELLGFRAIFWPATQAQALFNRAVDQIRFRSLGK